MSSKEYSENENEKEKDINRDDNKINLDNEFKNLETNEHSTVKDSMEKNNISLDSDQLIGNKENNLDYKDKIKNDYQIKNDMITKENITEINDNQVSNNFSVDNINHENKDNKNENFSNVEEGVNKIEISKDKSPIFHEENKVVNELNKESNSDELIHQTNSNNINNNKEDLFTNNYNNINTNDKTKNLEAKTLDLNITDDIVDLDKEGILENLNGLNEKIKADNKIKSNKTKIKIIKTPFNDKVINDNVFYDNNVININKTINCNHNQSHFQNFSTTNSDNIEHNNYKQYNVEFLDSNSYNCNNDLDNLTEDKKLFDHNNSELKNKNQQNLKSIFLTIFLSEFPKLFKSNDDVFYLSIFTCIWILLILFEFIYGFVFANSYIISDSFFNIFKIFAFVTCLIALVIRKSVSINNIDSIDNIYFFKTRIEQIAALCNSVMITIISLYMMLNSLHMITEEEEFDYDSVRKKENEVNIMHNFNFIFFTIKIIMNVLIMMSFSDFVLSPNLNIKLQLRQKYKEWKNLSNLNYEDLTMCSNEIKKHNSTFINFHSYTNILLVDLLSSFTILILLYILDISYEKSYLFACIINLLSTFILTTPVFNMLFYVFLNGRTPTYDSFYEECHLTLKNYDNYISIIDEKWWMISQNELSFLVKISLKNTLNEINRVNKEDELFEINNIKHDIYKLANKVGLVVKMKIDIDY